MADGRLAVKGTVMLTSEGGDVTNQVKSRDKSALGQTLRRGSADSEPPCDWEPGRVQRELYESSFENLVKP